MSCADEGDETSRVSQRPPEDVIEVMREGWGACREVAIRVWPFARTRRERESPKPEVQPVISQVSFLGWVVIDMVLGF